MMGDRPAPLEAMVELRQNRMIQPWPPSTTSTGSSIPSLTTPRDERQSRPMSFGRSGPTAAPSWSRSPRRKSGRSTNSWNGWKQPRPKPNMDSTGWAAASETSKATTANEGSAVGSWPSPRPVLNSKPPPGPGPERPRNSTAISIDQSCRRYCEGRSRPSVGSRHHGHPPLTLADANRPEPCQLPHRRRNWDLGKGTELNAV